MKSGFDSDQLRKQFCSVIKSIELMKLFEHLPGTYFVTKDREGRVMSANAVAVELCGFECEADMIGKTDYDIFTSDRADIYVEDDRYVFETGESIVDRVELAPDPNHSINWFVTTKIPLRNGEGEIVGLACLAKSMTDAYEKLLPYMEMNEVLEYIRTNYAQPIKADDLAQIMNLSVGQFERNFKKVFDISPKQHILNVRLRAACRLLQTSNDTIASIALDVGFYDHSHFCRCFKRDVGVSPSEYRKR